MQEAGSPRDLAIDGRPPTYEAGTVTLRQRLWRRLDQAPPAAGATTWTATATGPTAFTATDGARHVSGIALNGEAAEELLTSLSTPPGARAVVQWSTGPLRAPDGRRLSDEGFVRPPALDDFVRASTDTLDRLRAAIVRLRERWPASEIDARITTRAEVLNRTVPLIDDDAVDYVPADADGHPLGGIWFHDWISLTTVVGGNVPLWNGFAARRPAVVGLIIRKLLSAEDPAEAAIEIMTDDHRAAVHRRLGLPHLGHAHLRRYPGPAGPIHRITDNGTHRTHALRLLGVPWLAAQIHHEALPLRIHASSTWGEDAWGGSDDGPAEHMWRALRDRGLLTGAIRGRGAHAVLEPDHVTGPWLLGSPRAAATISAAYERIYPGALGIPASAMVGPGPWLRWLFDKP